MKKGNELLARFAMLKSAMELGYLYANAERASELKEEHKVIIGEFETDVKQAEIGDDEKVHILFRVNMFISDLQCYLLNSFKLEF